jgi:flagellar hook assembly protein FlgD
MAYPSSISTQQTQTDLRRHESQFNKDTLPRENFNGVDLEDITSNAHDSDTRKLSGQMIKTAEDQLRFTQQLLLTQLEHQYPGNEFDTNKMAESILAMITVGQNDLIAKNTAINNEFQRVQFATSMSAYINQDVQHSGGTFDFRNFDQDVIYTLPAKVNTATLHILNSDKQTVKKITLDPKPGRETYVWNGTNQADEPMPEGIYSAYIVAFDEAGKRLEIPIRLKSFVTDVAYDSNKIAVLMSGRVPIDNVQRVGLIDKAIRRYLSVAAGNQPPPPSAIPQPVMPALLSAPPVSVEHISVSV